MRQLERDEGKVGQHVCWYGSWDEDGKPEMLHRGVIEEVTPSGRLQVHPDEAYLGLHRLFIPNRLYIEEQEGK